MRVKRNVHAGRQRRSGLSLNAFTEDELEDLHLATLEVLERTGVFMEDQEARELMAAAGCAVDEERRVVRIPPLVVEDAIRSAPSKLVLCGRSPEHDVVLEDGRVGFTSFGEGLQVVDVHTGELRESTKQDVADCARIIDALSDIDVIERPIGAHDVPQDAVPLHNAEAIFANTTKHAFIAPLSGYLARRMREMAAVISGSDDNLRRRPILSWVVATISPLKVIGDVCQIIIEGARSSVPVLVCPNAMAGATSPVTLAGTLVMNNAETLAGITLSQVARRGAPVIYGSATTAMDLRFASASVGTPELALLSAGAAQMARRYLLPSWVAGA
jgi:trimethylamine--corrinoid protein Co-methyltransferase